MARILVAEDSPAIRLLIRRRLEMAGHEVVEAEDGHEALEHLGLANPPDLLMIDENMPGIDGAGVISRARAAFPDLPVIVVSGRMRGSDPLLIADARFRKPIDFDRLLAAVDSLTGQER